MCSNIKLLIALSFCCLISCNNPKNTVATKFNEVSSKGYSQSVEITHSNYKTIYISGQVPVDSNGEIVGINNLEQQTEQVFKNIKKQLEIAGGSMEDLINIECFFTDISKIASFRVARDKFINLKQPPASTAVEVNRLIHENFMIEINAIAVIKQ